MYYSLIALLQYFVLNRKEAKMILAEKATDAEARVFFDVISKKHKTSGFNLGKACFPISSDELLEEGYAMKKCISPFGNIGVYVPYLLISLSSEKVLRFFMDLLELFKGIVNVSLEWNSTGTDENYHSFFNIDSVALRSTLWDFEDFLMDSGYVGIAVFNRKRNFMILLDTHKHIIIYNWLLIRKKILTLLEGNRTQRKERLRTIIEMPHCHSSSKRFDERLEELKSVLKEMSS